MTAFHRLMYEMADGWAELVLIDVGPNLGAINRAALIASDHVACRLLRTSIPCKLEEPRARADRVARYVG